MRAGTGTWIEGSVGMTLNPRDSIKADADSRVVITFFEGSTIELKAGTQIEVAELAIADSGSTTILIKQQIGETINRVKKLADPASRYEIETPAGVAAVRGTVMYVMVAENAETTVISQEGFISVIAQGVEVKVPEGTQCFIISGQPPSTPVPIPTPTPTPTPPPLSGGGGGAPVVEPTGSAIAVAKASSNDASTSSDPSGQGTWNLSNGSPVWTGDRYARNTAVTTVSGAGTKTISISITNAYPNYQSSVGLTINNTASFPVKVTVVTITKGGGANDPDANNLEVVFTGALDVNNQQIINSGNEALGAIYLHLKGDSPQNTSYKLEIAIYVAQSI
jgi:hypothetical protein